MGLAGEKHVAVDAKKAVAFLDTFHTRIETIVDITDLMCLRKVKSATKFIKILRPSPTVIVPDGCAMNSEMRFDIMTRISSPECFSWNQESCRASAFLLFYRR